jgi:hypothetical protein
LSSPLPPIDQVVAALDDETLFKAMLDQLVSTFPSFEGAPPRVKVARDRLMLLVGAAPEMANAVKYLLDRSQENPDLGYYVGPGMQSFHLLCKAEAKYSGRELAEVEKERGRDLQHKHSKRKPEVVERRDEVHRLQSIIDDCPRCRPIANGEAES